MNTFVFQFNNLKHLFIILTVSSILLQTFSNSFILVNYQVNKEYISKNLCENKNKPMLHCNGKCHLQKQLAAQDKKDKSPFSQTLKDKFEVQYFSEYVSPFITSFTDEVKGNSIYSFSIPTTSLESIFHPPSVLM